MSARAGYEHDFFEPLSQLEPHSFWFRARNRLIVATVQRHFGDAASLLEIGCGTGFVLTALRRALPHVRLVGSELFREGLVVARRRLPDEVALIELDATRMQFSEEFDVVGAFDVLEHIDDDVAVLAGVHRALVPGGGLVLLVPQHPGLWSEADRFARHARRYTRADLLTKVERAGFEVLAVSSWMTALLPAMLVARLVARVRPRAYDPVRELRPGPLNGLFERLLHAETALVTRGVDLPVGGSLLVVARRST